MEVREASVETVAGILRTTTADSVVAGTAPLALVVGFSVEVLLAACWRVGQVEEMRKLLDHCAGAAREEAGADGTLAVLYQVTEHRDFASSSTGQLRIFQSTLIMLLVGSREAERVWPMSNCQHFASSPIGNCSQVVAPLGRKSRCWRGGPAVPYSPNVYGGFPLCQPAIELSKPTSRNLTTLVEDPKTDGSEAQQDQLACC